MTEEFNTSKSLEVCGCNTIKPMCISVWTEVPLCKLSLYKHKESPFPAIQGWCFRMTTMIQRKRKKTWRTLQESLDAILFKWSAWHKSVSLCTVDMINQNNLRQNACVVLTNGEWTICTKQCFSDKNNWITEMLVKKNMEI